MSPDEQEARSRHLSNDVIMLLPLSSGSIAIFNRGGDLCGITPHDRRWLWDDIQSMWHPPTKRETQHRPNPTLEELFK